MSKLLKLGLGLLIILACFNIYSFVEQQWYMRQNEILEQQLERSLEKAEIEAVKAEKAIKASEATIDSLQTELQKSAQ